ncbi:MAG: L-aspartate oxidase [Dictyoglomus sp.]|jgi:L-aspartate oxidase|uniref:L-aspartate oxidase n=1 Tax=Dictyoglomus turgidum (strain DSM 6724 / Z-1310) TaxID=515635 RepID=B8DZV2_DICTD|nr:MULTISPECIES: L-aspartate oxidase [Dictyoglomus]ACK42035.1 L-aspartate oxidase [Dictyoglomus turgidum DSM 6724]PNV80886.1 MAG: L-aspartate oxidase [Dictyoglomus turgidum]HBU31404.1 L-aspartate oxidase [Dictyoglomus sp.]
MIERFILPFSEKDFEKEYDLIIVGSGIAGLISAYYAPENFKIALFSKDRLEESNTYYAQGGIAVALNPEDSPELHYKDTLSAGADFNEEKIVKIVVQEGIERVKDLIKLGVNFDKIDGLAFTKEAAHSKRRIIHAQGDATGYEVARTLINIVKDRKNTNIYEHYVLIDLLTYEDEVYGGVFFDTKERKIRIFTSKYIILATGGAGQLYLHTTNPLTATGDGIAIAFRAGARIMDLEFFQFHPTSLDVASPQRFLISEAVRGEGAYLLNAFGERFMLNYHPLAELAPRDVVTRAIFFEMLETQDRIYLDLRPIGEKKIKERFPNIYKKCMEHGIDITKELVPVSPAAHYFMGGIETDEYGRTNLKNLYACGETACTGLHGANRLASNSLLEGLVFGKRCIDAILNEDPAKNHSIPKHQNNLLNISLNEVNQGIKILKKILWDKVGIIRNETELKDAENIIDNLIEKLHNSFILDRSFVELKNMLLISKFMINSALIRKESRGAHFRIDYPKSKEEWKKHIIWEREKEVIFCEVNSLPSFKKNC